jgi:hypothetical protein
VVYGFMSRHNRKQLTWTGGDNVTAGTADPKHDTTDRALVYPEDRPDVIVGGRVASG